MPVFQSTKSKTQPITTCAHNFSHALSKLHIIVIIVWNSDWFIMPVVIGQSISIVIGQSISNFYFGTGYLRVIPKLLLKKTHD